MQNTLISRNEGWLSAWVGNELMMMNGESGCYLSLSESGGKIWEMLSRPATIEQLTERLASEYQTTLNEARTELLYFLEQMQQEKTLILPAELIRG